MNPLEQFFNNEPMREAVRAFIIQELRERAVDKVFKKAAIAGIYEANQTIESAFTRLAELFGTKEAGRIETSR